MEYRQENGLTVVYPHFLIMRINDIYTYFKHLLKTKP